MTENQPREFDAVLGGQYKNLRPPFSNGKQLTGLLLQLNPVADALLSSNSSTTNYGNRAQLTAGAWTMNGNPFFMRSLLKFDIPPESSDWQLLCARLFLFAEVRTPMYGQTAANQLPFGHLQLNGASNEWLLSLVSSAWSEETVTWNTQPSTRHAAQIVPASTSSSQDYEDIDITGLVRFCQAEKINHGFLMQLKTEAHYRAVTFYSRKVERLDLRPRLDLYYIQKPAIARPLV